MLQLALLDDTPPIQYKDGNVSVNIYDVKTEKEWAKIGFKVEPYERRTPFIQTVNGDKFFRFDQVDIIRKVPCGIYRKRIAWLDTWYAMLD